MGEASAHEALDLAALLDDEPAPVANGAAPRVEARSRWRQLLAGASPREVLARLVPGDPLELRGLVAERVRARSYLCDADRVFLRAVARVARFAVRYRGQPDIDTWLAGVVDEALLDVLRDELEFDSAALVDASARATNTAESELAAFVDLARPLGLDPAAMRAACARFNHLPESDRAAFFALVIDGGELDEVACARGRAPTDLARAARRALGVLLAASEGKERNA